MCFSYSTFFYPSWSTPCCYIIIYIYIYCYVLFEGAQNVWKSSAHDNVKGYVHPVIRIQARSIAIATYVRGAASCTRRTWTYWGLCPLFIGAEKPTWKRIGEWRVINRKHICIIGYILIVIVEWPKSIDYTKMNLGSRPSLLTVCDIQAYVLHGVDFE